MGVMDPPCARSLVNDDAVVLYDPAWSTGDYRVLRAEEPSVECVVDVARPSANNIAL